MKKSFLKILLSTIIISIIITINAFGYVGDAANFDELEIIILEQLNLTNYDFDVAYTGSIDGIKNMLNNLLEKDPYLKSTVTSLGWSITGYEGDYKINITAEYIMSESQRLEADEKIDEILDKIIKPYMTTHEKVKAVHDYIVQNGEYDTAAILYSDYDLLTEGKSVCNGYAILTFNMLNKLDIPVRLVFGSANETAHVWNMVKLDDYWFHLDTTWNDPVPNDKNKVSYKYYMLSDNEILKDHEIDDYQNLPKAKEKYYSYLEDLKSNEYNSYIYNKILTETGLDIYNEENTADTTYELKNILQDKIKNHPSKILMRFSNSISQDSVNNAMSELLSYDYISEISYTEFQPDSTGNYNILNMYIKYKKTPDYIDLALSDNFYNTSSKVNFNVYAVYGTKKENITKNVLIYPYNENFLNISGSTITFNDAGSQNLVFEYEGVKTNINISAINVSGFEYITDERPNNPVNVKVFDKYIDFTNINQWPFIDNGRTLVPLRTVFEVLNCHVKWDQNSSSAIVEHGDTLIVIPANGQFAYINGTPKKLDVSAKLVNNRIMVPLRFISESINKIVLWDDLNKTVLIY